MARSGFYCFAIAFCLALVSGCAGPGNRGGEDVDFGNGPGKGVTQTELQQDLQRFTSVFTDRIAQGLDEIRKSKSSAVREEGIKRTLLYGTAVMEIVSSPAPEIALLDMLVFVTLSREVFEKYWIPTVFKERGRVMLIAFERSEKEIWAIADKVMSPHAQADVKELIVRWKRENPGQIRVEGVRLGDFSQRAGKIARERAEQTGGLLSTVRSGVVAADEALLMADRVLFLMHRMPFLLRLQASLGASDIFSILTPKVEAEAGVALKGFDRVLLRVSLYVLIVGTALAAVWLGGYWFVRRRLQKAAARLANQDAGRRRAA